MFRHKLVDAKLNERSGSEEASSLRMKRSRYTITSASLKRRFARSCLSGCLTKKALLRGSSRSACTKSRTASRACSRSVSVTRVCWRRAPARRCSGTFSTPVGPPEREQEAGASRARLRARPATRPRTPQLDRDVALPPRGIAEENTQLGAVRQKAQPLPLGEEHALSDLRGAVPIGLSTALRSVEVGAAVDGPDTELSPLVLRFEHRPTPLQPLAREHVVVRPQPSIPELANQRLDDMRPHAHGTGGVAERPQLATVHLPEGLERLRLRARGPGEELLAREDGLEISGGERLGESVSVELAVTKVEGHGSVGDQEQETKGEMRGASSVARWSMRLSLSWKMPTTAEASLRFGVGCVRSFAKAASLSIGSSNASQSAPATPAPASNNPSCRRTTLPLICSARAREPERTSRRSASRTSRCSPAKPSAISVKARCAASCARGSSGRAQEAKCVSHTRAGATARSGASRPFHARASVSVASAPLRSRRTATTRDGSRPARLCTWPTNV